MRLMHELKIIRILCELPGGLNGAYSEDIQGSSPDNPPRNASVEKTCEKPGPLITGNSGCGRTG